jgi:hypothetical protein
VVVIASAPTRCYVDTGETRTSGTGRNQKGTRLVKIFDHSRSQFLDLIWRSVPLEVTAYRSRGIIPSRGSNSRAQVRGADGFTLASRRPKVRSDGLSSVGLAVVRMSVRTVDLERTLDW